MQQLFWPLFPRVYNNANSPTVCIGSVAPVLINECPGDSRCIARGARILAADTYVVEQDGTWLARMIGTDLQIDAA